MKTLNEMTLNDILGGCGVHCKYKDFIILYCRGYVTLYYKNKDNYINSFMTYSNNIGKIKNEIKNEIKKHDIKSLLNVSIDTLKNCYGFKNDDIEHIASYYNIMNDKNKKHKKVNEYLLNEIKEHFIFRLVRR